MAKSIWHRSHLSLNINLQRHTDTCKNYRIPQVFVVPPSELMQNNVCLIYKFGKMVVATIIGRLIHTFVTLIIIVNLP